MAKVNFYLGTDSLQPIWELGIFEIVDYEMFDKLKKRELNIFEVN